MAATSKCPHTYSENVFSSGDLAAICYLEVTVTLCGHVITQLHTPSHTPALLHRIPMMTILMMTGIEVHMQKVELCGNYCL